VGVIFCGALADKLENERRAAGERVDVLCSRSCMPPRRAPALTRADVIMARTEVCDVSRTL